MVAKTVHIVGSVVVSSRFHTAISFIVFEEKRRIENVTFRHASRHRFRRKNVVERAPFALKAVGGLCAVAPRRMARNVGQTAFLDAVDAFVVGIVVEIACDEDFRRFVKPKNGIDGLAEPLCHLQSMGLSHSFPTRPTGCVDNENVERVARNDLSAGIKDVACRAHILQRLDANGVVVEQAEREGRIEQRHVDAAHVGRVGRHVFIACIPKQLTLRQIP